MAYPRKKAVRASSKKPKPPTKKEREGLEERMAEFLWVLCGVLGSLKFFEEYMGLIAAYQRLPPPARKELRLIAAEVIRGLKSVSGVVVRERTGGASQQ